MLPIILERKEMIRKIQLGINRFYYYHPLNQGFIDLYNLIKYFNFAIKTRIKPVNNSQRPEIHAAVRPYALSMHKYSWVQIQLRNKKHILQAVLSWVYVYLFFLSFYLSILGFRLDSKVYLRPKCTFFVIRVYQQPY